MTVMISWHDNYSYDKNDYYDYLILWYDYNCGDKYEYWYYDYHDINSMIIVWYEYDIYYCGIMLWLELLYYDYYDIMKILLLFRYDYYDDSAVIL